MFNKKQKTKNSTLSFNAEYENKNKQAIFYAVKQLFRNRKNLSSGDVKSQLDKYIKEYEDKHDIKEVVNNA